MRLPSVAGAVLLVVLGLDCARTPRLPALATVDALEHPVAEVFEEPAEAVSAPEASEAIAPGTRYASLSGDECEAELSAREIAHEALAPRRGISAPVRLRGRLSGVGFRTLWPRAERARTSYEIYDCRLVLALDDFAKLLRARGVVDVMLFSAYRPPPAGWSEPVGLRHEGGLAIDIGYFGKEDGTALNVEWDFNPRPRERICAPGPPPRDATPASLELRRIACEAASSKLFHLALTPAYDHVHRDHFHLEVTPGKSDFVAR
ncbi:MAG: hypothetical protein KF819_09645 [Labilithrix sp.]|nr:hypothetical protein [Labilithrix sp.]